jgi:hypothetical protein
MPHAHLRSAPIIILSEGRSLTVAQEQGGLALFANVRWQVVYAPMGACVVCFVVGLALWVWMLWVIDLLGLLVVVGDIAWTIMSLARAKRAGEGKLKF